MYGLPITSRKATLTLDSGKSRIVDLYNPTGIELSNGRLGLDGDFGLRQLSDVLLHRELSYPVVAWDSTGTSVGGTGSTPSSAHEAKYKSMDLRNSLFTPSTSVALPLRQSMGRC